MHARPGGGTFKHKKIPLAHVRVPLQNDGDSAQSKEEERHQQRSKAMVLCCLRLLRFRFVLLEPDANELTVLYQEGKINLDLIDIKRLIK